MNEVKKLIIKEFNTNPNKYHPIDMKRIRDDEWQIERFYLAKKNVKEAFKQLCNALKWKKEIGIHEMVDTDFPTEFYKISSEEILGNDPKDGTLVIWTTSKYTKEFSGLSKQINIFTAYEIEHLDRLAGRNGIKIISDVGYASLTNVDIEMNKYSNFIMATYYPGLLKQAFIFNLSTFLGPIFTMILSIVDNETSKRIRVIRKEQLANYIDEQFIPIEFKGKRQEKKIRLPQGTKSYKEIISDLTPENINYYDKILNKIFISNKDN